MKKCPYCAEEIQDEAIKCKHCGSNIGDKLLARARETNIKKTKKLTWLWWTLGIILFLLIISGQKPTPETPKEEARDAASWAAAYIEVSYPKTKVLDFTETATKSKVEDGVYVATGQVDTQNIFGATIRTFYTAKLRKNSKGDWEVFDCYIAK